MEDRFDALNEHQKTEVMNFLQITGTEDTNSAIHYMEMSGYDVSNAVNLFFTNQEGGGAMNFGQQPQRVNQSTSGLNQGRIQHQTTDMRFNKNQQAQRQDLTDQIVREYRRHLDRKAEQDAGFAGFLFKIFRTTFDGARNIWNSVGRIYQIDQNDQSKLFYYLVPIAIRGETPGGEEFRISIQRQFPNIDTFNFQNGTFQENIDKSEQSKLPFLVYFHAEGNSQTNSLINEILKSSQIKTYVNKSFHILGLNGRSDEARALSSYVQPNNFPCFACFKKTLFDKTELLTIIPISTENTNTDFYLEQIKNAKQTFYMLLTEDDKVKTILQNGQEQRRQQFAYDNIFGFQPSSPQMTPDQLAAQQAQIEEDRMLRQAQEEAFKEAERMAERQQKQKQEEEQRKRAEEERKRKADEERSQIKQIKKANLPDEPAKSHPDAFTIAFRVPDGQRIMRRFLKNQQVQDDLEFENEERKFDLVQTFPALSLLDHTNKTINEVFPDSVQEIIIVKEL